MSIADKPYEWLLRVKWMPDSERLAVTRWIAADRAGLYFVDRKSGEAKRVLTETDPAG